MSERDENLEFELQELKVAEHIRKAKSFKLRPPRLHCYNCDEPLRKKGQFCDSDCRDDFDSRTKAEHRNKGREL